MATAHDGGKVVSLTHRPPLPPGNAPGTHFCKRLSRPQGHTAIGRIIAMKNSNDTIWDRTSELPVVAQHPNHCATAVLHMKGVFSSKQLKNWGYLSLVRTDYCLTHKPGGPRHFRYNDMAIDETRFLLPPPTGVFSASSLITRGSIVDYIRVAYKNTRTDNVTSLMTLIKLRSLVNVR